MAEPTLTRTRIRAGLWEGVLSHAPVEPAVEALWQETPLAGVAVTAIPGRAGEWAVTIPIPASALNDGVQTILIRDRISGEKLGHFTLVAGVPLEDDLRAEIDLLRAELDMLKRAFRRHCVETGAG